jgi:hypothetical protein
MTNTGKIGRLPDNLRDQLNRRLLNGEPGKRLVEWLNSLPETRQVLTACFGGRPINEPNLTAWKAGGFQDWLVRQDTFAQAREMGPDAREIAAATDGRLTEHLSTVVAARYAAMLNGWHGETSTETCRKFRLLHELCQHVLRLRRNDRLARLDPEARPGN